MKEPSDAAFFHLTYPEPISDALKMELGRVMADRFYDTNATHTWNYPALEAWIEQLGFQYLDWSITDPIDSIRFAFVRAWEGGDETFILEYSGHDELILSLFNKVRDEVLP